MRKIAYFLLFAITTSFASLVLIDGPDIRVSTMKGSFPDSIVGEEISSRSKIKSGESYAYFALCDNSVIRLEKFTTVEYIPDMNQLLIHKGRVTLFNTEKSDKFCTEFMLFKGSLRYASEDTVTLQIGDSLLDFAQGNILTPTDLTAPSSRWYRKLNTDVLYLYENLKAGNIPDPAFTLAYPSRKSKLFSYGSSGTGGIATYKDDRYYYGSLIWKMRFWELKMAYDFWFAFKDNGEFYKDAWDEWADLIAHIDYIQLYQKNDPFYLRVGLLENLNYGRGLLMSNYNNAVFLPFDRLSGLETRFDAGRFNGGVFINDISHPRLLGAETELHLTERFRLNVSYIGDFDLFAHIEDSDNDSYPDEIDPEPNLINYSSDSIIIASGANSIDDFEYSQLHTVEISSEYDLFYGRDLSTTISGALGMHSELGTGISLPNIDFKFRWISLGVGLDLQSPGFDGWIFDRNYEAEKAKFSMNDDSNLVLITKISELEEEDDWLYGWNNSFSLRVPRYISLVSKYRDIYRGDVNDRKFSLKLKNSYPFSDIILSSAVFIDNRNFDRLFHLMNDEASWGAEIEFRAHKTAKVKLRYRERYHDSNSNGAITSKEIERNFDGNVTVDFDYWWDKFVKWYELRQDRKRLEAMESN